MKKPLLVLLLLISLIGVVCAEGYLEFINYPQCENNVVRFSMKNVGDERVDINDNPVVIYLPKISESKGIFSRYIINPGQVTEFTSGIGEFLDATTYSLWVPESNSGSIPNVKVICHTSETNNEVETSDGGNTFQCIDGNWKKLSMEPYCKNDEENLYIDKSGNEHCRPSSYSSVTDGAWCYKEEPQEVAVAKEDNMDNKSSIQDIEDNERNNYDSLMGYIIIAIAIIIGFIILAKVLHKKK